MICMEYTSFKTVNNVHDIVSVLKIKFKHLLENK